MVEKNKHYNLGYKVLTLDMKSLGLRKNPNILQYPLNEWYVLPKEEIRKGKGDCGGIWLCGNLSNAKKISRYMAEKHNTETKIFKAMFDKVLYSNSYRIKTNAVKILEEILD